jgi:hypothetical protein
MPWSPSWSDDASTERGCRVRFAQAQSVVVVAVTRIVVVHNDDDGGRWQR